MLLMPVLNLLDALKKIDQSSFWDKIGYWDGTPKQV